LTPSANLAANISAGLPQVLSDPRTNLLQCLEAIMVAELADNECWTALAELAQQGGHDELAQECQKAIAHERDHLRKVRGWIAVGQGRATAGGAGTDLADGFDAGDGEEFTFTEKSAVDREGFAVSEEEEVAEGGATSEDPKPKSPSQRRAVRRRR
jgi:hypothetical protein